MEPADTCRAGLCFPSAKFPLGSEVGAGRRFPAAHGSHPLSTGERSQVSVPAGNSLDTAWAGNSGWQMDPKSLLEAAPPELSRDLGSGISLYRVWHGGIALGHRLRHGGATQCPGAPALGTAAPPGAGLPAPHEPCRGPSRCAHPGAGDFGGAALAPGIPAHPVPGSRPPCLRPFPPAGGCHSPGTAAAPGRGNGKWRGSILNHRCGLVT